MVILLHEITKIKAKVMDAW